MVLPWSQAFPLCGWCQLPAVAPGGTISHHLLCPPGPAPGPGMTEVLTFFLLALPCWLPTDFLPEGKQGIQSLDPPPPAFFLVKSPFPPSREQKNQFPGFIPCPGIAKFGKLAGFLWAVQEGDLGSPPHPPGSLVRTEQGPGSEVTAPGRFLPGCPGDWGGGMQVRGRQHWREGVRCTEPGRLGILRQRRLSQRQSSSRRKVSRKALLQSA